MEYITSMHEQQEENSVHPYRCLCFTSLTFSRIRTSADLDLAYKRLRVLGEGTYGVVFEALHIPTGRKVALKKIRINNGGEELAGIPTTAIRETILLRELKHENIVELFEVAHISAQLWLSFELCDMDLRQYLRQKYAEQKKTQKSIAQNNNSVNNIASSQQSLRSIMTNPSINSHSVNSNHGKRLLSNNNGTSNYFLPLEQCKLLSRQLLQGVAYCHSRRVIHRDLKPQNLLLNKAGTILKIADLGLARTFATPTQKNTHEVVTLWYRAPELLLGDHHYTLALDVWSVGCIIAEIATGRPLFHGDCEIDTLFKIFKTLGTPRECNNFHEKALLSRCPSVEWNGVSKLQYYQQSFPKWQCNPIEGLEHAIPIADPLFIDFLSKIFKYQPESRPAAAEALNHPWLAS